MEIRTLELLEFDHVKRELATFAQSNLGRAQIERLQPMLQRRAIEHALQETTEARRMLDAGLHVPLHGLSDLTEVLGKVERGGVLQPPELLQVADLLRGAERLHRYMHTRQEIAPLLFAYSRSLSDLTEIEQTIESCLEGTVISSNASNRLRKVRSQIKILEDRIQDKLGSLLSSATVAPYLQDGFISVKEGRFVIPVKAAYKHKVDGIVVTSSGSGSTVFIEPTTVRKLVNELQVLRAEEEDEVYQVLAMLTGEVGAQLPAVRLNMQAMAAFDFALSKGRYSRSLQAAVPTLNEQRRIVLLDARHPLLGAKAVPLQFSIGQGYRTLLITGPNTGGKTVTLKTIGLLTAMAQAGLHIPALPGSEIAVFQEILADIGDGQNLVQSLSTFSSHIKHIAAILQRATPACLVLLDEIGTGTDPREGAALAGAILDQLQRLGAVTVVTTHFGDLKTFAERRRGFKNARMDFDPETLQPLFRLVIGESGESNGLWIASRLGVSQEVIACARLLLGGESRENAAVFDLPEPELEPGEAQPAPSTAVTSVKQQQLPVDYSLGDRVFVHTLGQSGIVASLPDHKGMMTVIVKRQPVQVNHTRLTLQREKEELYPDHEHYDLNIVLISKDDRKLAKKMAKRHVPGAARVIKPGQDI